MMEQHRLLKWAAASALFWVVGQPDVRIVGGARVREIVSCVFVILCV